MATLLTLPSHLIESINHLLREDLELPDDLREPLLEAIKQPQADIIAPLDIRDGLYTQNDGNIDGKQEDSTAVPRPPTIDYDLVERLSRWATSDKGKMSLEKNNLDTSRYTDISLLSGTEIYVDPKELARLRAAENPEKPNPYLPSYLSPAPPSFGSEYRNLTRTLSTIFNVIFSILGSAGAVYMAAVSGAGYSREKGVLLGILAGLIVGIADGVLVVLFMSKVEKDRRERHERGRKLMKGSGKALDQIEDQARIEQGVQVKLLAKEGIESTAVSAKQIQLRRRALKPSNPE
ncbi:hypothetical protein C349_05012 [Cryptococcus neoformans var. grubii Br795]|uniref:Endoplasmic reticulum-based factor for assembly of V-ATPase n=1 Tax=Cryptococcus neoformans Tu259-1 TaxID=1230072 RepID=A0A854QC43_CRYNE|nr:hypothetical protein C353_04978 [Cryptococcus neoformans var. grubii AD1-83a]OXG15851.1 hypothetical protein C361_05295 [Cryptococcus neoformans var. grubii Tu259-1]OXG29333.1 hypothetical protein C360_05449 [Cryptococcus neoformans var. grubii Bt15]OXG47288.1 hypothetical protein C355_04947 [Cryptococcus neoformans var. grubii Th84]OXG53322.1 hypothetical protein C354_04916 [Cryptococcus neoformans var. grubii MW-RSA1955]OXG56718.1 hypothetical protein C352_04895 [Cryptococcus neoformans v